MDFPGQKEDAPVTIVIVAHNNWPLTKGCLDSLKAKVDPSSIRDVFLVDNGSDDGGETNSQADYCFKENLALPRVKNTVAKDVKSPFVSFIDNDLVFVEDIYPNLLSNLNMWHEHEKKPGLVSCRQWNDKLKVYMTHNKVIPGAIPQLEDAASDMLLQNQYPYYTMDHGEYSTYLLVSMEAFKQVGGFDERYSFDCYDMDFNLSLRKAGWGTKVSLRTSIVHLSSETRLAQFGDYMPYMQAYNRNAFIRKWGSNPENWP